jgi:AraC-like DNA-binding protein
MASAYGVETLTTHDVPAAHRLEMWSDTVTSLQGALQYDYPVRERFQGTATCQRTGRFQLVSWHITQPQTLRRTARHVRADDSELYRLVLPLGTPSAVRVGDHDDALAPAEAVLVGPDIPFEMALEQGSRGIVVSIDRHDVDARLARRSRFHHRLSFGSGAGGVLASTLDALVRERGTLTASTFDAVCLQATALACLIALDEPPAAPDDLDERVRRFVREHAHDPDLSGDHIARHVGWSLRHVQAVLRDSGTTPSELIRDTRLDLARAHLSAADRRTIAAVAHASGFRTVDAFERSFRRRFRTTPSAYRAAGNSAAGNSSATFS